jgi:hypothetical protein
MEEKEKQEFVFRQLNGEIAKTVNDSLQLIGGKLLEELNEIKKTAEKLVYVINLSNVASSEQSTTTSTDRTK